MFVVSEEAAEAVRRVYQETGEFAAAVELRRHFPGIPDNAEACRCVHSIIGWQPLSSQDPGKQQGGNRGTRLATPSGHVTAIRNDVVHQSLSSTTRPRGVKR